MLDLSTHERATVERAVRAAASRRKRPFSEDDVERAVALALDLHRVIRAHGVTWWEAQDLSSHVHAALDSVRMRARADY